MSNSIKIRPLKADCSMRTDGETEMTNVTVAFRIFADKPQNLTVILKILPFCTYTLASAVLIFLEASLQDHLRYGRERRCCVLFNFF
jgi:hypothetical protein